MAGGAVGDVTSDIAALLTGALGVAQVASAVSDPAGPIGDLLSGLTRLGWSREASGMVSVVAAGTPVADGSTVVVVLHGEHYEQRAWPGWDEAVLAAGYDGCARADRWTWYVRRERVGELGPRLGALPVASPALVDEVIAWRTAALTRWANRADHEAGRANKELAAELHAAKARLALIEASPTWRLARGLRALVPARLVRALRR